MLTLIHYPLCPFSRSVRLCLAEFGIEVDLQEEKPWEWRQDFLEINPSGMLPVLLLDEKTAICGSYAISEYLAETAVKLHGGGRRFECFPGEAGQRAEVRRLVDWFHGKFSIESSRHILEEKVYSRYKTASYDIDITVVRAAQENLRYHLRYVGYLAGRRNWLAGYDMSFADLAAAAHFSAMDYLGDVPWNECEPAKTWYTRVKSRPSFRSLLSEKIPGIAPAEIYSDLDF
ncbi:MAG: glutathione S-transferase family protein [Methyloligellaceae bacterium]